MKRSSILGLLISIIVCLQPRLIFSKDSNGTRDLQNCKWSTIATYEYLPAPKTVIIQNISGAIWIGVALIAILCNALIIHVVRVNKHMHTTTNYLIVNMAVGDTFAAILITALFLYNLYHGNGWIGDETFGKYIYCRLSCPFYYLFTLSSIYSLVVITFDRFLAVTRPLKYKHRSSWSKYTIPCIWMTSIALASFYATRELIVCPKNGELYCINVPSKLHAISMLSFGVLIPHFIIFALYAVIAYTLCTRKVPGEHAQKDSGQAPTDKVAKRVTLMIICILVAFDVAYAAIFLGFLFPFLFTGTTTASFIEVFTCKLLLITNGISNALIYAVFNENFRLAFKKALPFNRYMASSSERLTSKRCRSSQKSSVTGTS